MRVFLGIDGGGTKTKFCLTDADGQCLATALQPTCHYLQCGMDGMARILQDGTAAVCCAAGISRERIVRAFFGCPGFGEIAADTPAVEAAVARGLGGIAHRIGNDAENALAGALNGAAGINIVAGTGSIGFGKNAAGESMRCGGWHQAIGSDEGSGYWIGMRLLTAFTRQSDGREEKTPLYEALRDALNLQDDFEVISRIVAQWQMDRTKIAALAPLAAQLCARGDSRAAAIVDDAAGELAEIVCAIHRGLHFTGSTQVSYTGGVFQMGEWILKPLRERLEPYGLELVQPQRSPEEGAAILAMQEEREGSKTNGAFAP